MDEKNQKTIVAFIAGLLIGGLLVWVFFIASGSDDKPEPKKETPSSTTTNNSAAVDGAVATQNETPSMPAVEEGNGTIRIDDQDASARVAIAAFVPPQENGWIAVQDVNEDGSLGRVLGAARFAIKDGLVPTVVELLRPTVSGKTYRVVLYGENGDKRFSTSDGVLKNGETAIEDTFEAN